MSEGASETTRTAASGAELLVRSLESEGVREIFGLCGHTTIAVLDALARSPIRFVGVHHEQMAAHAADAQARLTGRPGVVLVHLGPGLTNAITGIANAMFDCVPLVIISGNVQSYFSGRNAHMETNLHGDANQAEALVPLCKRVWRIDRVDRLLPAIEAAFRICQTAPKGPVLIDVMMDVFSERAIAPSEYAKSRTPRVSSLSRDAAEQIVQLLREARRPVLHLGAGIASTKGCRAARELAHSIAMPVTYELLGKGIVPDRDDWQLGMTGFWGTPAANAACRDADLILSIGSKFGELDSSSWRPGVTFSIPPTRLVHVSVNPLEIGRSYPTDLGFVADPEDAVVALAACADSPSSRTLQRELHELRLSFAESLRSAQESESFPLRPERVLAELEAILPEDSVLVGDTGWNKNGIGQQLRLSRPGRFLCPGGYATMGFGPAAALGAAVAVPDHTIIALVGDGAFLTNLSVVVTAVEERLPVVWAVMNNSAYATITGLQMRQFGTDYGTRFDTSILDLPAFARSVGADGARVEAAKDLAESLDHAIKARKPYVLDIPITLDNVPTTGIWDINDLFERGKRLTSGWSETND